MHAHVIKTYRISLPEEFKVHVRKQIVSGQDFSRLDGEALLEKKYEVYEELEKGQGEDYNVWSEGDSSALILDIDEILSARKSNEEV